jgi:hypothetical protein
LFQKDGASAEEKQALDAAMCCLQALEITLKYSSEHRQSTGKFDRLKAG